MLFLLLYYTLIVVCVSLFWLWFFSTLIFSSFILLALAKVECFLCRLFLPYFLLLLKTFQHMLVFVQWYRDTQFNVSIILSANANKYTRRMCERVLVCIQSEMNFVCTAPSRSYFWIDNICDYYYGCPKLCSKIWLIVE